VLGVEAHQTVSWEQFKDIIADTGGVKYGVVEQKRYEECTVARDPDNDVIVAAVLVTWTETLIMTLKVARKDDWPIAHTGQFRSARK
jgi:hypothetical protein